MKTTMGIRTALLTVTVLLLTAGAVRADLAEAGPAVDPFKPLIVEPLPPPPPVIHNTGIVETTPPPPVVQPVQLRVHALAEDNANHVAVIELEGETYIAQPGMALPSKENPLIDIQKVSERDVTVFDRKVNRLRKVAIAE